MALDRGFSRAPTFGVVLLGGHLLSFGLNRVPPATLALIIAQTAIFLNLLPKYFPSAQSVCISSYLVINHRDWKRLILGALAHGSDLHLYYNMLSLLYKGSWLERRFGTIYFIYLICVFTALTGVVYIGLGVLLSTVLHDNAYIMSCAIGFSGVLFALKVLTTHYTPSGPQFLFGLVPIPSKHVYWAELLLIQMLVPNASFIGHLAGIIVGMLYTMGHLQFIMNVFLQPKRLSPWPQQPLGTRRTHRTSNNFNRGRVPPSAPPDHLFDDSSDMSFNANRNSSPYYPFTGDAHRNSSAYYPYTGGLDENEQYERAVQQSLMDSQPNSNQQGLYPNLDELRSRRAEFYQ